MRITHLSVTAFKGLSDGSYELSAGLTVVRGPNEAGKSSFQQAVLTGLFGDPSSSAARYDLLHSWRAGRKCSVMLGLDIGGDECELVRDFEGRDSLLKSPMNGLVSGRDAVKDALAERAGLRSESVYSATACIKQQDLVKLRADVELRDMLQQTMTGGEDDADVSTALKKLDKEINSTFRKGRKGGEKGPWLAAQEDLNEKLKLKTTIAEQVERTVGARNTIAAHAEELDEKRETVKKQKALLERVRERQQKQEDLEQLETKCSELQTRIQQAEKLSEAISQREAKLAELPAADPGTVEGLKAVANRLEDTRAQLAELQGQLAKLDEKRGALAERGRQTGAVASKRPVAGIGLVASTIVAALAVWQGLSGVAMAWVLFALAVIAGAVSVAALLRAGVAGRRTIEAEINAIEAQRALLAEQVEGLQATQTQAQQAIEAALQKNGAASMESYLETAERRRKLAEQNTQDASKLAGMLGDASIADLQTTLNTLNLDRMGLRELLETPAMLAAAMEAADIRALEDSIAELETQVAYLDEKLRHARAVLEQAGYDVEDEVRIDEQVAAAQQRVDRLGEYQDVLTLTEEVLEEARRQTVRTAVEVLGPTINEYLAHLTEGRYDEVRIGDDELDPVVYSREKSDTVNPETELSLATKEQLYLACRLAFSKLLWETDGPPILLDDPLVNFDERRKARALELLREISGERQVVLFTCSDEYDSAADTVIVLERPD